MLRIIGITGGVGSGKSTVLDFLKEEYGAVIIKADDVGRAVMETGTACYGEIVSSFGQEVVRESGELDRELLAKRIFNNPADRELLDSIVHPAVKTDICRRIKELKTVYKDTTGLLVIEAALLIEENYDTICDELWFVYAPKRLRLKRLKKTRGYSRKKSLSIMKNQLSSYKMRRVCQLTIDNSKDFEYTISQLRKEYRRIMNIK